MDRNPDEWLLSPQSTRAYYSLETNEIVFPAGMLQKPLYDIANPLATNYGAVGSILGHEIMHAFDHHGARKIFSIFWKFSFSKE